MKGPWAFVFRRKQVEQDMEAELRSHLRLRAAALETEGTPHAEAKRRARLEFGSGERWREECREALGVRLLTELRADLRQGLRQLRRNPAFTLVAVLTLALGIAVNTAIFSLLDGMLLRALPYPQPQQLYVIHEMVPQWSRYGPYFGVNGGNFKLWQKRTQAFSAMTALLPANVVLSARGRPRQIHVARVQASFFPLLGVEPRLGRGFSAADDTPGHKREVIISDGFWRQTLGADPDVIGSSVTLDNESETIVGVLPPSFTFPGVWHGDTPVLYFPLPIPDAHGNQAGIGGFQYTVIARRKPGASAAQALAELNAVEAQIARQGDALRHVAPGQLNLHADLVPLLDAIVGPAARALWALQAATLFLLLIVCANLANLLLARNTDRVHEVAVRASLGATRARLARQFWTEGLLLAVVGGGLGLLLADLALRSLLHLAPAGLPRLGNIHLNAEVLIATLAATGLAALLFATVPAMLVARIEPEAAFRSASPRVQGNRRRLRGALIVGEVALCAILLAGSLLLIQSLARLNQANRWMQQEQVLAVKLITPYNQFGSDASLAHFYQQALAKIRSFPGVINASVTPVLPLRGGSWGDDIVFREAPRPAADQKLADFYFISPGFGEASGLPLVAGRRLQAGDQGKNVVLISESIAQKLLPGRNPIGMHLLWAANATPVAQTVIGVLADVRDAADRPPALAVYIPIWTFCEANESLIVRTRFSAPALAPAIRRAVWSVNPEVAIPTVQTFKSVLAATTAPRRYETWLGGLFAVCAVLLAALGLYGVISYSVAQRRHEIGIRMALGAPHGVVLASVVREGLRLVLVGLALGLGAALVLTRLLGSMLYAVRPDDPATFVAVAVLLASVALLACYLPARRASRVDPAAALRCE